MTLEVGDRAEPFELPFQPGQMMDLADHLGRDRIVLLFFPLAFSSVCTRELCTIRDDWSAFEALDAVVLGISVDSPFVTARFREEQKLPFPLLSDFNREVMSAWGVLCESFFGLRGVAKRSVFIIGTDELVSYAWVSDDADVEPNYQQLREALANTV